MTVHFVNFSRVGLATCLSVTAVLGACGGGGGGEDMSSSTQTTTGRLSNSVSALSLAVGAGQSTTLAATAVAKGVAPSSMVWSVAPLSVSGPNDPAPTLSDTNCANATFAAAISSFSTGRGFCQIILTAPINARSGVWRITNTAMANGLGMASHFVDVAISALPDSGLRIVENSTPVVGYANTQISLALPWAVDPGVAISNVSYLWEDDSQNPTATSIVGVNNASATAVVTGTGMYRFKLTVSADVNGRRISASGAFMAVVYQQSDANSVSAGSPKVVAFNEVAALSGEIRNADPAANYSVSWSQLDGLAGGPARVALSNANTLNSGFVAPSTVGLYGFEMTVVKTRSDGSQSTTKAQTTVMVLAQAAETTSP